MRDYLRPTDPQPRIKIPKVHEDNDEQKKNLIKQSFGMLMSWAKTRPTARLYEGSVYNDEGKVNALQRRRAKNRVARRSRRINRMRG